MEMELSSGKCEWLDVGGGVVFRKRKEEVQINEIKGEGSNFMTKFAIKLNHSFSYASKKVV